MPTPISLRKPMLAAVLATTLLAGPVLAQSSSSPTAAPPKFAAVGMPGAKPAADMQAVLDALAALGGKPVERLTPADARKQPSPADAYKTVLMKQGQSTAPDAAVVTRELPYGTHPQQVARLYTPAAKPSSAMPVIVYYHGGGFVIADLDTYDATPRLLSQLLGALVVSVEYRHAPEAKFPAQHDDAAAAYRWTLINAAKWGGDTRKLALAGESAGGNLAVATAIHARDNGLTAPRHVLAIYPIANSSETLPSRRDSGAAKPLNTPMLKWFGHYWAKSKADMMDPRINLVGAKLRGLPPVTIVNAQIDPLRSDGETLAIALRKAGVSVDQRSFVGVTHEFFGMGKAVRGAFEAETYAGDRLKAALR